MTPRALVGLLTLAGCVAHAPPTTGGAGQGAGPAAPTAQGPASPAAPLAPLATVVPRWAPQAPPAPLPALERREPLVHTSTLPNGLEVVVVEHHARPLVSVRLLLPSGAAADPAEKAGVTWFTVAGLLGTFDRLGPDEVPLDPDEKSARRQVAELGASLTFDVGPDRAWLGIDGFAVDAERYLERLSAVVRDARHGEATFMAQVEGVAAGLEELELTDADAVEQLLGRMTFGQSHPYARPAFGTAASVDGLGVEDVVERQATLLLPRGSTLLVAGDVDAQRLSLAIARTFAPWRTPGRGLAPRVPAPAVKKRSAVTFIPRKPSKTVHLCAARALSDVKASDAELELLAELLSARLSNALREKEGLTYSVSGGLLRLRYAKALLLCSRLDAADSKRAVASFLDVLGTLAAQPPSAPEVDRARAQRVAVIDVTADELPGIVRAWTHALSRGSPVALSAQRAALQAVTADGLAPLATKLGRPDWFQLAMMGERASVAPAVKALRLGALRTPQLGRAPD